MIHQTRSEFETELMRSRPYEVAFSRWLQDKRGFYTLPVFDFYGLGQGFAPHLDGNGQRLTAPDILACKEGVYSWFEIKLKECAPLHRISKTYVTGLPLRNWQHYHIISEATASPVWLVFIHLNEQEVRAGEINAISAHNIDHKATMDNGGTVFYSYHTLHRLMPLAALEEYKVNKP
jgi:hypothetical protein